MCVCSSLQGWFHHKQLVRPTKAPSISWVPIRIASAHELSVPRSRNLAMLTSLFWFNLAVLAVLANAQRPCYVGAGLEYRAPPFVVPCLDNEQEVACCSLGDVCLSGNTCWNFDAGNLYQYGCTDVTYTDQTCPYKCGWNTSQFSILLCLLRH
jgi:hypothetical protein